MSESHYNPNFSDGWSPVDNIDQPVISCDPETRAFRALVAPYGVCLLQGSKECWTAPTSPSGYQWSYADGFAAWIGWAQNHADINLSATEARDVYANTSAAVARVKYYDLPSRGGIYAFGELHPSVDDEACDLLNTMALSGDWRGVRGRFDFAGSQVVLTPGFRRDPQKMGRRQLSVRKYSNECVVASMSWENPEMPEQSECKCKGGAHSSVTFDADMLARTAAASEPVLSREYAIAVLNKVTGDRRAITGISFDDVAVSLNVNHDQEIQSIVGDVSDLRVDGQVLYGRVSVYGGFEFSELAATVLESGLAGFSVELDDSQGEWMPAAMASVRGIDVGNLSPEDEIMVQAGRLRGVGVVQTPAFIETEAARTAATDTVEVEPEVEPEAEPEMVQIAPDVAAEIAATLIANAGEFPILEVSQ